MNKNKVTKGDIIEAVTFILMTVGIITMIVTLHQLNELHKSIKELHTITITK
jgi:hypothetical protein